MRTVLHGKTGRKCVISDGAVYLPNADKLGFAKYKAKTGDFITFDLQGDRMFARVLGKIVSCDSDGEDCTGWLAVLMLSRDGTFAFVTWVNPIDVLACHDSPAKFWAFFAGVEINAKTIPALVASVDYGSMCERYIDNAIKRVEDVKK